MNIKFKKMFKTAIIFFTVFVMVFNSFAAISVSDGSAFVTKAEFSADLNNLSNRMSALENSIDAKIDSLVSSYLSRNGIWNGERQTVNKNGSVYYWDRKIPDLTIGSDNKAAFSGAIATATIVSSITKSGLLVGFTYYTDGYRTQLNTNNSRWGWKYKHLNEGYWRTDSGMVVSFTLYENISGTKTAKFSNVISNVIGQTIINDVTNSEWSILGGSVNMSLPSQEIKIPFSFFVSKGSSISFDLLVDFHTYGIKEISAASSHALRFGIDPSFYVY